MKHGGEVHHMTYKNSADCITIEQALRLYEELGVCVIIDEGQHVTFINEYPMDRGNGNKEVLT